MNVARAMGNSRDQAFVPDLARAFEENEDPRVKGMAAWALGHIGGNQSKTALEGFAGQPFAGPVAKEVQLALDACGPAARA